MTDEEFSLDDDRPRYFVRTYRTEDNRTLVWVPDLDLKVEGDRRWVDDAEAAAIAAIAQSSRCRPPASLWTSTVQSTWIRTSRPNSKLISDARRPNTTPVLMTGGRYPSRRPLRTS